MRVVLDTNVLISALLKPGSVPDRAIEAFGSSGGTLLYDARIEAEYREVAHRRKFRAVPAERRDALLARVLAEGERIAHVDSFEGAMIDDDDRMFVEVAIDGGAHALVTGNLKHFDAGLGFEVFGPAELLRRLEASS